MYDERSTAASAEPVIVAIEDLESEPHAVFGRYRPLVPFITRNNDGVDIVLRAGDVRQLITDHRMRQSEMEFPALVGIADGPLFDLFKYGMLSSNGSDHRRRRSPFSATFAARLIADLRPRIRKTAGDLMIDLRAQLAGDCELWAPPQPWMPHCGAYFPDTYLPRPPPDMPRARPKVIKGGKG